MIEKLEDTCTVYKKTCRGREKGGREEKGGNRSSLISE